MVHIMVTAAENVARTLRLTTFTVYGLAPSPTAISHAVSNQTYRWKS